MMKPVMRPTGQDAAFKGRVEELLGDRGTEAGNQALRVKNLPEALRSAKITEVVSRIVAGRIGRDLDRIQEEIGQIITTQTFVASYSVADLLIGENTVQSGAITVANIEVSGFNAGAFTIEFTGWADNLHRLNSMGVMQLLVDGVEQSRVSVGIEVTGVTSRFAIPVALGGVFTGSGTSFMVELRAWTRSPDDNTVGGGGYFIRSGKLLIHGGVN